jgi:carboxylesterase
VTLPALFQADTHQPFTLAGGAPAALLVHGFPGTPAELRPLAAALNDAGWTTQGILLPGFGPQLPSLPQQRAEDWHAAVRAALDELLATHAPVLLIGYSLGGALALHAVTHGSPPHGLVLLAPFWHVRVARWQRWVFAALRRVAPNLRPLARVNFDEPRLRAGLEQMLPGVPLDDQAVQTELRQLVIPAALLDALQAVFSGGYAAAPHADLPTLVVQGAADETAQPADTRALVARLPGPTEYVEVSGGHALVNPAGPGWEQLRAAVLAFAAHLTTL